MARFVTSSTSSTQSTSNLLKHRDLSVTDESKKFIKNCDINDVFERNKNQHVFKG